MFHRFEAIQWSNQSNSPGGQAVKQLRRVRRSAVQEVPYWLQGASLYTLVGGLGDGRLRQPSLGHKPNAASFKHLSINRRGGRETSISGKNHCVVRRAALCYLSAGPKVPAQPNPIISSLSSTNFGRPPVVDLQDIATMGQMHPGRTCFRLKAANSDLGPIKTHWRQTKAAWHSLAELGRGGRQH